MQREGEEIHVDSEEASAGASDGRAHVRWILAIGTLLAIIALSAIWITGALTQGDVEEEATASGRISSEVGGDATDSIVGGEFDDIETAGPGAQMEDGLEVVENDAQEVE